MFSDMCKVYGLDAPQKMRLEVLDKNTAQMAEWLFRVIHQLDHSCLPLMSKTIEDKQEDM